MVGSTLKNSHTPTAFGSLQDQPIATSACLSGGLCRLEEKSLGTYLPKQSQDQEKSHETLKSISRLGATDRVIKCIYPDYVGICFLRYLPHKYTHA